MERTLLNGAEDVRRGRLTGVQASNAFNRAPYEALSDISVLSYGYSFVMIKDEKKEASSLVQ